jgi:uncharacterized protein
MAKAASRNKLVYDILLEVDVQDKHLTRTVAVSADAILPEMYRAFQGSLAADYISEHDIEHKGTEYINGRGSRTSLRSILSVEDVFVCRNLIANTLAPATVLRAYEVTSRRHYPKVLAGEGALRPRSSFDIRTSTWSAQGAVKGNYPARKEFSANVGDIPADENLASILESLGGEFTTVAGLEGFFVALLCGPPIMPTMYLSLLLGELPQFASLDEMNRVIGVLMSYHNRMIKHLNASHVPSLEPIGGVAPSLTDVKAWSGGFYRGMELASDAWKPILRHPDIHMTLSMLYAYAFEDEDNLMSKVLNEESRQAVDARYILSRAVLDLYAFCKRHFSGITMERSPIRRDTEKMGRNSACSCGSGKKYKRCCGS